MAVYVTADKTLPRSLDVQISVSSSQTATAYDLTTLCVVCENLGLLPNANRIRWYSSLEAIQTDYGTNSEPYRAATAFFAQSPRPTRMAVGEAWLTAQPAMLVAPAYSAAAITAIRLLTAGNLTVTIGSTDYDLNALDFSGASTVTAIAAVIQAKLTSGSVPATCAVKTLPGGSERLTITTTATGSVTMSYPTDTGTGTFAGTALLLTEATGVDLCQGYTPDDIAGELQNIKNAASVAGEFIYGWILEYALRDSDIQVEAAAWALAQDYAIMPLVSNDASASDASYDLDFMSVYGSTANKRIVPIYHDNPQQYPDASILALMLSVNYSLADSVLSAKFKLLPGITTVALTETEYQVLLSKGYNCYTDMGGGIYTYREGSVPQSSWWMDTVINMDNFVNELSTEVYNVFLRNKKIPYTRQGQMLLVDACRTIGNKYTYNGTFADREVEDSTMKSGYSIVRAVEITPTPVWQATASQRASRIGPPIAMVVQDSGAIHEIAINVELVS